MGGAQAIAALAYGTESIKPVSKEGTYRLVRAAIQYAIDHKKPSVTLVHKGNIMKFTDGLFFEVAREVAKDYEGKIEPDDVFKLLCTKYQKELANYVDVCFKKRKDILYGIV